jgi:hypothetical protein
MKKNKLVLVIALLGGSLLMTSCGSNSESSTETEHTMGKEHTSAYVCPMHCEDSGSDEMGSCPVCGMDYVKNKDVQHEEHHDHGGH